MSAENLRSQECREVFCPRLGSGPDSRFQSLCTWPIVVALARPPASLDVRAEHVLLSNVRGAVSRQPLWLVSVLAEKGHSGRQISGA